MKQLIFLVTYQYKAHSKHRTVILTKLRQNATYLHQQEEQKHYIWNQYHYIPDLDMPTKK